jgi:DNA-binding NtrC family response regulator
VRGALPAARSGSRRLSRGLERRLIAEGLRRTKGNKEAAARLLELGRTTPVAKLRRLSACVEDPGVMAGAQR